MTEDKKHQAFLAVEGQIFPLRKEVIRLGRHQDNDFIVMDETVSRFHAEIRKEDDQYVVYDCESTGGVYVNHKPVERAVLHSGDMLALSAFPMIFMVDEVAFKGKTEIDTGRLKRHYVDDENDGE